MKKKELILSVNLEREDSRFRVAIEHYQEVMGREGLVGVSGEVKELIYSWFTEDPHPVVAARRHELVLRSLKGLLRRRLRLQQEITRAESKLEKFGVGRGVIDAVWNDVLKEEKVI